MPEQFGWYRTFSPMKRWSEHRGFGEGPRFQCSDTCTACPKLNSSSRHWNQKMNMDHIYWITLLVFEVYISLLKCIRLFIEIPGVNRLEITVNCIHDSTYATLNVAVIVPFSWHVIAQNALLNCDQNRLPFQQLSWWLPLTQLKTFYTTSMLCFVSIFCRFLGST